MNQRWLFRKDSYKPSRETIRTAEYDVAPITMAHAKEFVLTHHYSRSYPACRFRHGLFHHGDLVGVAVFSVPMAAKVLTNVFPGTMARDSVELGRFVLLDEVPANGESWFFARCRELLRQQSIRGVVAFSDDVPRTTIDGSTLFAGHIGTIYQASNAVYLGRGTRRTLRILPDGTVFSERATSKIRNRERGWQYAAQVLIRHGARDLPFSPSLTVWLRQSLEQVTRPLKHVGNHKYAWSLNPATVTPVSLVYPKRDQP